MGHHASTVQKVGNDAFDYFIAEKVKYRDVRKELKNLRKDSKLNTLQKQSYSLLEDVNLCGIGDAGYSNLCVLGGISKISRKHGHHKKKCQDDARISEVREKMVFGLFDGHGPHGEMVSSICVFLFDTLLADNQHFDENPALALTETIETLHKKVVSAQDFKADLSGATSTLISVHDNRVSVAWVGDSRAILITTKNNWKNIHIVPLTRDHDFSTVEEKERIIEKGGHVARYVDKKSGNEYGPLRCWKNNKMQMPGLAMSKSVGDMYAQSIGVTHIADSNEVVIPDDVDHCALIVASDGLWNVMTNEDVASYSVRYMKNKKKETRTLSEKLSLEAQSHWFRRLGKGSEPADDISIIASVFF